MKRCQTFIILLLAAVFLSSVGIKTTFAFAEGDGSPGDPYQITTCTDLQDMQNSLNKHYVLNGDINCSATSGWNSGSGFAPVGATTSPFTGSLDGAGHAISHLFIYRPLEDYIGLFSATNNSILENIFFTDINITGRQWVASLAGQAINSTTSNSSAAGSITGKLYGLGGLIGYNDGAIYNASSSLTIIGVDKVGGIVGTNNGGTVSNSNSSSNISVTGEDIGGIVGFNKGNISNSFMTGSVHSTADSLGGISGYNEGNISNSYSTGDITGDGGYLNNIDMTGGLNGANSGSVLNSYATGNVSGRQDVGGLVGTNNHSLTVPGSITNSFSVGSVIGDISTPITYNDFTFIPIGGLTGDNVTGTIINSFWFDQPDDSADYCYPARDTRHIDGCTTENDISYFYTVANQPMSSWSYPPWSSANNGVSYPTINQVSPTNVGIASISADSISQLTVTSQTAADSDSGLDATPYWFEEKTGNAGGVSSTIWQASKVYVNTGLSANTRYVYRVKARDASGNQSPFSSTVSKYTLAPTPTNISGSAGANSIVLTVDSLSNQTSGSSGYYFSRSGGNSGWIQTNTWTDTGLTCGTSYTYSVKYRNGNGTETSPISSITSTSDCLAPAPTTLIVSPSTGNSSSGSVPLAVLATLLAPSASTTAYLNSLGYFNSDHVVQGCPIGYTCTPILSTIPTIHFESTSTLFIFTHNLWLGVRDDDVKQLQEYLNSHGFVVASTGSGSPGNETTMFGQLTKAALIRFQKDKNITAVGYFGPITRAYVNTHP